MTVSKNTDFENTGAQRAEQILAFLDNAGNYLLGMKQTFEILVKKAFAKTLEEARSFYGKLSALDFIFGGMSATALFLSGLVFLSGIGVTVYQAVLWLRDGVWSQLPLLALFDYFFEGSALQAWLQKPESWYGLHEIVSWLLENVPLSLACVAAGGLAIFLVTSVMAMAGGFRYYQFKNLQKR
ncbi:MAG: hypothetical protein HZA02_00370 [Nitrospinae bacterium]|nr:hypothetical protein [Nitrospinota bacterium]